MGAPTETVWSASAGAPMDYVAHRPGIDAPRSATIYHSARGAFELTSTTILSYTCDRAFQARAVLRTVPLYSNSCTAGALVSSIYACRVLCRVWRQGRTVR